MKKLPVASFQYLSLQKSYYFGYHCRKYWKLETGNWKL